MRFPTERRNEKENFPSPRHGERIMERSPTFIWLTIPGEEKYTLEIFDENGNLIEKLDTGRHFATPSTVLSPGNYSYCVSAGCGASTQKIPFSVDPRSLLFRRPTVDELLENLPKRRPRHLFFAEDIAALTQKNQTALAVLRRNAELAYRHGMPKPPAFHKDPTALPYREYFGELRDYVDRDLVATSLLYALTGDERAARHAKELALTVVKNSLFEDNFNTGAALFGKFGDEVGLSIARCMPAVFDLLYPLFSEEERASVAKIIAIYGDQCKRRIDAVNYMQNPSNSHVGRLPAYLGEAALALAGEGTIDDKTVREWLTLALDVYSGIFPYYGGADGSWAEGAFYATSYTKWFLPFFSLVERLSGKRLDERPFYHRFTNFLYHFAHPDYEIHPFGDGYWCTPDSPEWPGFFAQNPFNYYADRFGPEKARALSARLSDPPYYSLHLLDLFLPTSKRVESSLAAPPRDAEVFPDGGFAVLHSDVSDPDRITVMARASRFGSDSHRHADQGSFAIFAGGKALVSPSGYFGRAFGTAHHRLWTNTTAAHNAPLIDGVGQPTYSIKSTGRIVEVDATAKRVILDMSGAYDNITLWQREIELSGDTVTVRDTVEAEKPVEVSYPLHSLSKPSPVGNSVIIERSDKRVTVTPTCGGLKLSEITDRFGVDLNEGEPAEYAVEMPTQYHITYKTEKAARHELVVEYKIDQNVNKG